jgi:hypothetical protein
MTSTQVDGAIFIDQRIDFGWSDAWYGASEQLAQMPADVASDKFLGTVVWRPSLENRLDRETNIRRRVEQCAIDVEQIYGKSRDRA